MSNCYHLTFNLRDNGVRLPPKLLVVAKVTVFKRFLEGKSIEKEEKILKSSLFCFVYSVHDIGEAHWNVYWNYGLFPTLWEVPEPSRYVPKKEGEGGKLVEFLKTVVSRLVVLSYAFYARTINHIENFSLNSSVCFNIYLSP